MAVTCILNALVIFSKHTMFFFCYLKVKVDHFILFLFLILSLLFCLKSFILANLNIGTRTYTVKGLSGSTHKFTVKAYTSAGEDTGGTAAISMKECGMQIITYY